jgi:hypothetical protein
VEKRRGLAIGLVLGGVLAYPAHAAHVRTADQPLVILTEQGRKDAEDVAFFSSVRALAAEIGIAVSTQEVPTFQAVRDALLAEARQESKPFLVAWILREDGTRKIHLFDPWENHLRTRTVAAGVSATANAETLALILRAELLAYMKEPEPAPPSPPEAPPPAPPSPPAAPPPPDPRWAVATSYFVGNYLRDQSVQQGARLGLSHLWPHLRVGVSYGLMPGQRVSADDVTMTLRRHPFALDVGYASCERHRLRLVMEVLLCGDVVSRHTSSATAPLTPQPDSHRLLVGVGGSVRAELLLSRNIGLHLALAAEAPLNPHDFQIMRGTVRTTVARLSPIHATAEVGLILYAF